MMLSEKNFFEFATKSYRNTRCFSTKEFLDDYARFKYVKRLLNRYKKSRILQERLILNHLISIYNVFDITCANEMLFFKCEKNTHAALRSFLIYLSYLPTDRPVRSDKKLTKILDDL
jgi:hypothetical protein